MSPEKIKKILVCPLNWGLGHASRIIPVIYELIQYKYDVYIGADGSALELLKQEFPGLKHIRFPSFTITYGKKKSIVLQMFIQVPKIILGIIREHIALKKLINSYSLDFIISDNRFGLWSKKALTVYITHQINIKLPSTLRFFESLINKINRLIILKYNQCWIPDFAHHKNNLTGELSHNNNIPNNAKFIGPLSRFKLYSGDNTYAEKFKYDILVIMSGPEPQRTMLEEILTREIKKSEYKTLIVQGKPGVKLFSNITDNITRISHLSTGEFLQTVNRSKYIICRSGYSTIMDLITLKRNAILVPTPGQTEQEYLAGYLSEFFCSIEQNKIKLEDIINRLQRYQPLRLNYSGPELKNYIQNLGLLEKQAKKGSCKKSQSKS
ncbi:MAG: hypothetical protein JSV22_10780 [Bacteroidales bacterium]|nr:MAG: hypothetical protein JSV22_10780 [Bacteroidales bacterium]